MKLIPRHPKVPAAFWRFFVTYEVFGGFLEVYEAHMAVSQNRMGTFLGLPPHEVVFFKGFLGVHAHTKTPKGAMLFGGFLLLKTAPKKHGTFGCLGMSHSF